MIGLTTDTDDLRDLARALGAEADGKKLRRELTTNIRKALAPAVAEAKSSILSMTSGGLAHDGPPLRAAIARQVKAQARVTGRSAGAKVRVTKKGMPREFAWAARRTNRSKGWRHPVYGTDTWVSQTGKPGWFDDPMQRNRAMYRKAVREAMAQSARRITRRV